MKKLILSVVLGVLYGSCLLHAQAPSWQWAESAYVTHGCGVSSICNDAFGNSFVIGTMTDTMIFGSTILKSTMSNGNPNTYLVKYDSSGTVQWAKVFHGVANSPGTITTDVHGNLYVSGNAPINTIIDGDTFQGGNYLAKFKANGSLLWIRPGMGGVVTFDAGNNMFMTGTFTDSLVYDTVTIAYAPQTSVYVFKTDSAGNLLWVRTGIHHSFNTVGTSGMNIRIGSDGSCYIASDFGYGVPSGADTLSFDAVDLIDTSTNPVGSLNTFVVKYSATGTLQWARQSEGNGFASLIGISPDDAGNVFVAGNFGGGDVNFGSLHLHGLQNTGIENGGFVLRYDSTGHEVWASAITSPLSNANCTGVAADGLGSAYVAGSWSDTLYLGTDTALYQASHGGTIGFLARYDASGHIAHVEQIGQRSVAIGAMSVDRDKNIFTAGTFGDDSVPLGSIVLLPPAGRHSNAAPFFIAKLASGSTPTAISGITSDVIAVFPNPTTGTLYFKGLVRGSNIDFFDMLGARVYSEANTDDNEPVDLSSLAKGIYVYHVSAPDRSMQGQGKIVIE